MDVSSESSFVNLPTSKSFPAILWGNTASIESPTSFSEPSHAKSEQGTQKFWCQSKADEIKDEKSIMCSKVESVTTLDCESILPCCPESTCEEELDSFECSEKSFKVSEDLEVVILRHNSEQLMRQPMFELHKSSAGSTISIPHFLRRSLSLPQPLNSCPPLSETYLKWTPIAVANRRSYQLKLLDEVHYRLVLKNDLTRNDKKLVDSQVQAKQQVHQAQQTRNVRFDRRRPQTLELRRNSSRYGCAEFQQFDQESQILHMQRIEGIQEPILSMERGITERARICTEPHRYAKPEQNYQEFYVT